VELRIRRRLDSETAKDEIYLKMAWRIEPKPGLKSGKPMVGWTGGNSRLRNSLLLQSLYDFLLAGDLHDVLRVQTA
jgi:hypothetical protein